jgi:predicted MFS family arabinose efflux permease
MTLTIFLVIMSETLPAGLLTEIADDLHTSESAAGQLIGAFALGTVLTAIPAVALTRGTPRRRLLITGIAAFLLANALTALTPWYPVALGARFVAGACSGLIWGMTPGYASRIVPAEHRGKAIAAVMLGTPLALSIGTPLGTFAGSVIGWRWSFAAMSLLSLGLIAWVRLGVPDVPGQPRAAQTPVSKVFKIPGLLAILGVVVGWMVAHNMLYTYVAPFLASSPVGLGPDQALLVFGIAALLGIWTTSTYLDRAPRQLVLASLSGFAVALVALGLASTNGPVLVAAIALWGFTFGGAGPQLVAASATAAGPDADLAQSVLATVWNSAIFAGSAAGGIVLSLANPQSLPWILLALVLVALGIATTARRHAFPARQARST